MACASFAANTASTPGSSASATTLPEALRSRTSRRGALAPSACAVSLNPFQRRVARGSSPPMNARLLRPCVDEMSRHRDAGFVIVEPRDSVDRCRRKIPGLRDGNSRAPQQPRTVFRGGRAHHDDRLGAPRQQCREHVIFTCGVVARLCQDHGVAERLQFVGQALHRIGEDRIGDRRHQHADRTGAGPGQRDGKLVRHIAEFPHRGLDPAPCFRRHQIRQAHHAAHGYRRYAGQFGHGRQGRGRMGLFGACDAHRDGH